MEVELTFLISLCMSALEDERACFPAYMRVCESRETATDTAVLQLTLKQFAPFDKLGLG